MTGREIHHSAGPRTDGLRDAQPILRLLGKKEEEIEFLLDPGQPSPAPALEAALRTVGKRVQVTVEDTDR